MGVASFVKKPSAPGGYIAPNRLSPLITRSLAHPQLLKVDNNLPLYQRKQLQQLHLLLRGFWWTLLLWKYHLLSQP